MSSDLSCMRIVSVGLLVPAAHYGSPITRRMGLGEIAGQGTRRPAGRPHPLVIIEHRFPVYREALSSLHFFTILFPCLIAVDIGDEAHLEKIHRTSKDVILLSLIEGGVI